MSEQLRTEGKERKSKDMFWE